jgi:uncharacterized DUF497 family protein
VSAIKLFVWNADKSQLLKIERGISFEDVIFCIANGQLLDVVRHPNVEKYAHQRMFVVRIDQYVYLVPFVESKTEIFLKTIIPSRKATRQYLRGVK